jgi:uncharacterized damage-inducible protein DinB
MNTLSQLKNELREEYETTKRFLKNYPSDKGNYAPHQKSMQLGRLSNHLVDIFGWPDLMLRTRELDVSVPSENQPVETREDLEKRLDEQYQKSMEALEKAEEKDLDPDWSLTNRGEKLKTWSKYGSIRHALNQITHHRAQVGVYFRLNNIPVPGSYGPSADDQFFG